MTGHARDISSDSDASTSRSPSEECEVPAGFVLPPAPEIDYDTDGDETEGGDTDSEDEQPPTQAEEDSWAMPPPPSPFISRNSTFLPGGTGSNFDFASRVPVDSAPSSPSLDDEDANISTDSDDNASDPTAKALAYIRASKDNSRRSSMASRHGVRKSSRSKAKDRSRTTTAMLSGSAAELQTANSKMDAFQRQQERQGASGDDAEMTDSFQRQVPAGGAHSTISFQLDTPATPAELGYAVLLHSHIILPSLQYPCLLFYHIKLTTSTMTDALHSLNSALGSLQLQEGGVRGSSASPSADTPNLIVGSDTTGVSRAESNPGSKRPLICVLEDGADGAADNIHANTPSIGWEDWRRRFAHLHDSSLSDSAVGSSSGLVSPLASSSLAPTSHPSISSSTANTSGERRPRRDASYADEISSEEISLFRRLKAHGRSAERTAIGSSIRSPTPRRFSEAPRAKRDGVQKARKVQFTNKHTTSIFNRHRDSGDEADVASGDERAVESEADVAMAD